MAFLYQLSFQPYGTLPSFTLETVSIAFDMVQTLNIGSTSTGAGAGKVTFDPFTFTRRPDVHSADFFSRLCSGAAFRQVMLSVSSSPGTPAFYTFTMGLVALKTLSVTVAEADNHLLENISLEYGQAACSFTPQNPDGTLGKAVATGWDRVRNLAVDPAKVGAP